MQVTVYCVETFGPSGRRQDPPRPIQFGDEVTARGEGKDQARRRAGVLVYSVDGDPVADIWQRPRIIARYGTAPIL